MQELAGFLHVRQEAVSGGGRAPFPGFSPGHLCLSGTSVYLRGGRSAEARVLFPLHDIRAVRQSISGVGRIARLPSRFGFAVPPQC